MVFEATKGLADCWLQRG